MRKIMKQLIVPFLSQLNEMTAEESCKILEDYGRKFSIETVNWPELFNYKPITTASIARSRDCIHLMFQVHGNCLRAVHTNDNETVHQDSCVEFFVKDPESRYYFNFEFNCIGTCKAARHFETRENAENLEPEKLKRIDRWSSIGKRAFNELNGLFSWELCVVIPFDLFDIDVKTFNGKLEGNFYKCADATNQPHYVTWAPVKTEKPDFHQPGYFGEIIFSLSPDKI